MAVVQEVEVSQHIWEQSSCRSFSAGQDVSDIKGIKPLLSVVPYDFLFVQVTLN